MGRAGVLCSVLEITTLSQPGKLPTDCSGTTTLFGMRGFSIRKLCVYRYVSQMASLGDQKLLSYRTQASNQGVQSTL